MTRKQVPLKKISKRFAMTLTYLLWVSFALIVVGMFAIGNAVSLFAPEDFIYWISSPIGALAFSVVIYSIAFFLTILPLLIQRNSFVEILQKLGLKRPIRFQMLLWALFYQGLFIGITILVVLVLSVIQIPNLDLAQEQELSFNELSYWYEYVAAFVLLVVLAPVFEELIFRGYLYGRLRKYNGVIISMVLTSVFFGVVHGQANVAIVVGLLSVLMCLLREKFDSVYPTIMMHVFQNGFAYIMLFIIPIYGLNLLQ
ncbi:CPBP family intramembrane metalloprotease [Candidatus Saccharibacteria bacterium]|nr:CPBP family intramembrane metalloprotease [Candidatus Saccharibacteria bacterium]NCU40245.1 CPBP family intramembrane metalloprotease [Candidatus Saccharibacteria bacterium]